MARPIGLTILLAIEVILFTIRFDGPRASGSGIWWLPLVSQPRFFLRFLLVAAAATATFGGLRLAGRMRRAYSAEVLDRASWLGWLLAHGVALVVFVRLSLIACEVDLSTMSHPGVLIGAWLAAGLATGLTWLGAVASPSAWLEVVRRGWRAPALGIALGAAAVSAGQLTSLVWGPLARSTFEVARVLLGLVSSEVVFDSGRMILGVADFKVTIAPECSGFEGIGLTWVFLTVYLWWYRDSLQWPRALLLLPLGTALIWLSNAVRIAGLILLGAWGSPSIALGGFHSQAGWLAFLAVGLGLVAISRRSSFFGIASPIEKESVVANPTAAYLGPFLAIVAASMITGAFSTVFDAMYGLRALAGGGALWYFRRDLAGLRWAGSWEAVAIGVVVFALWMALEPARTGSGSSLASSVWGLPSGGSWVWIAFRVVGSVLVVPIAEELAFRGYLSRRLISSDFDSVPEGAFSWPSFLISSAAFGLLHGRWLAGMLAGLIFGLALYRRRRIGDAVVAHAVANLLIAVTVLATGDWGLWS